MATHTRTGCYQHEHNTRTRAHAHTTCAQDTNALAATWGAGNDTTTAAGSASNCTGPSSMQWTNRVFGECVLDDLQMAGFLLGLLSNVCWFVAQSP